MVFLQENYTGKHAILLSVFPGFPERSNMFLGLGKRSENAIFNVHFATGVFHRQTRCFPECFPLFSVAI